jgi:RNA polymerase sigma factor (sigma-70 family)
MGAGLMANRSVGAAGISDLHTLYRVGVLGGLTDAQLLEHYVAGRDEDAEAGFAALVDRHGPMVLRVCRQVLGDPHDAEDAFQATFLVLARRAGSVRRRDAVASWLHGIARRVAMHARADAARRRVHERRSATMRDAETRDEGDIEGWPELHEELARLPSAYRESVVLCYMEGLTTAAAARRLGCAQGTVLARLSRARARLRRRLIRRGLTLSAGLVTAGLSAGSARAAVPAERSRSVITAAMKIAAGATAAGVAPASVVALAQGVLTMMFRSRLRRIVGMAATLGAVTVGIGMLAHRPAGARPPGAPAASVVRVDDPTSTKDGRAAELVVRAADVSREPGVEPFMGIVAIDPETGKWRTIYKGLSIGPGRVSPDGRAFVYSSLGHDLPPALTGIWVYDMTGQKTLPRRIFDRRGEPSWINEGRQVVIGVWTKGSDEFETWRVSADGSGRERLPIPAGDLVLDASRDGNWLATRTIGGDPRHQGRLTLVHPDGTGARHLTEGSAKEARFSIFKISPDSRRIAYAEITTVDNARHAELFVVDIESQHRRRIPTHFEPGTTVTICWSPDGSRLALDLIHTGNKQGSVMLVDLDGPNYHFRNLPLSPGRWNFQVCDWTTLAPGLRLGAVDEPPDGKTLRGRYQALLQEYEKAGRIYGQALKNAKTAEERMRAYQEKFPRPRPYVGRFLQIAESVPEDPSAVDALIWIVQFSDAGPEFDRAIDLLARHHAEKRKAGLDAASSLVYKVSPMTERLFRAVIDKNPDRFVRGMDCLWLGKYLRNQSEAVRSVREDKENAGRLESLFLEAGADKEGFERFRRRDPDALMTQAEAAFERVAKEFGDLPGTRSETIGQQAQAELNEIRNLIPGKPAPEVTGVDVYGRPMRLSDHRGRVVLISFWADWCASCRAQIPHERALTARMHDRPFVLLGVNGDDDKDKLRALIKKEDINWRSWWDGGGSANTPGPIARQFNVDTWPTLYLIDHRGVIRHKFIGTPAAGKFDAAIDELVTAAERDPDAPKP